ncbi:apomucin-like [Sarcophilus harrisii]
MGTNSIETTPVGRLSPGSSSSSFSVSTEETAKSTTASEEHGAETTTVERTAAVTTNSSGVTHGCLGPAPVCHGPLGEEKSPGDTWIINCHQCTCSDARTVDCKARTCPILPTCANGEKLIQHKSNESCCETAYCEPRTCFHNHMDYKIGASFDDPHNPCVSYLCSPNGFVTTVQDCPRQSWCSEVDNTKDYNIAMITLLKMTVIFDDKLLMKPN